MRIKVSSENLFRIDKNPCSIHMPAKILIVEDEVHFRDGLVEILNLEGFSSNGVSSVEEYQRWTKDHDCDILIVDRNLPDGDGLEILKLGGKHYGSIVLTCEGQPHDRIKGMNADADYYLVKPFPIDELISILNRLDRRMEQLATQKNKWILNSVRWEIGSPNKVEVKLTRSEFRLLACFAGKSGAVVGREEIIAGLGFDPASYDNRRLEVMIRRLRKKIEEAGIKNFPLQTVYGVGLAFTDALEIL